MSRAKLQALSLDLPSLPTSTVGSFPKPPYLVEARARAARNAIGRSELDRLERQATEFWIRVQEELGVDVLVDGEQYRGDMVAYFAETMGGFARGGLVRSYGNRYYHKPVIVGEVRWPGPMTVDWWRWTQALTDRPVKGMLTGPYTMMDWSFDDHYPNRRAACLALARELRKELAALLEAGARIVQIDEPALSVRPAELPFAVEALHEMVDGLPAYYVSHACFGAFEAIYPGLLDLPVDNLDLAISHTALDLLGMFGTAPFTKDLSLGVLDVHSHVVETPDQVAPRIQRGLEVLSADRIWVDPDCGLKTRTVEEARDKLAAMMTAVREARVRAGASLLPA
jgi:5-methyltetrahydropteroyltriglutamate--homocysteine methyltransferase